MTLPSPGLWQSQAHSWTVRRLPWSLDRAPVIKMTKERYLQHQSSCGAYQQKNSFRSLCSTSSRQWLCLRRRSDTVRVFKASCSVFLCMESISCQHDVGLIDHHEIWCLCDTILFEAVGLSNSDESRRRKFVCTTSAILSALRLATCCVKSHVPRKYGDFMLELLIFWSWAWLYRYSFS
jgi:hypothetical protein